MRKSKFLLFFLLPFLNVFAQKDTANYIDYYKRINEANYYFYLAEPDYLQAKTYFEKAFSLKLNVFDADLYNYAKVLYEIGDTTKSIVILEKNRYSERLLSDTNYFRDLSPSRRMNLFRKGFENYLQNEKQQDLFLNTEEGKIINQVITKYQQDIAFYKDTLDEYKYDSVILASKKDSLRLKIKHDFMTLQPFFLKHGFFEGIKFNDIMYIQINSLFLNNVDTSFFRKHHLFLMDQIKKGNLSPETYARAYDSYQLSSNLKSERYGYIMRNIDKNISPNNYFKFCNEIGLSPYCTNIPDYRNNYRSLLIGTNQFFKTFKDNKLKYNCVYFIH